MRWREFYKDWNIIFGMKGKGGAVEWTIGKLMAIVLLVVVLALVVYGVSSGLISLHGRTGGMFDEVLLFFTNWGVGGGNVEVECLEPVKINVDGVGDGKLTRCREYCEVEMEKSIGYFGSGIFHLEGDEISSVNDGAKYLQNNKIVDVKVVGVYREVYSELKEEVEIVFDNDLEKLKSFMKFDSEEVLEFKVVRPSYDMTYRWDGEEWAWFGGRYTGSVNDKNFIEPSWEDYNENGREILWGYYGVEKREKMKEGMSFLEFNNFIDDLRDDWDSRFFVYTEGVDKIEGLKIIVDDKEYLLGIRKAFTFGVHNIPLVFVDLGEDKVGIYYIEGEPYFYSDNKKGEYNDFVVKISDGSWEDIVKLNKIYGVLKTRCQ